MRENKLVDATQYRPTAYKVLIQPDREDEKRGALLLPASVIESNTYRTDSGTVVALGGGCFDDRPLPHPKVGDRVMIDKNKGKIFNIGRTIMRLMHDTDLLMILDGKAGLE